MKVAEKEGTSQGPSNSPGGRDGENRVGRVRGIAAAEVGGARSGEP